MIKIGTILRATNPCIMSDEIKENRKAALIVGKEYTIIDFFINDFVIKSEICDNHYFNVNKYDEPDLKNYQDYFEIVKE